MAKQTVYQLKMQFNDNEPVIVGFSQSPSVNLTVSSAEKGAVTEQKFKDGDLTFRLFMEATEMEVEEPPQEAEVVSEEDED